MSDDIRAKAQAVIAAENDAHDPCCECAVELARHVLTLEARLDLALAGCMQMREWLQSEDTVDVGLTAMALSGRPEVTHDDVRYLLRALAAAMPGGDA